MQAVPGLFRHNDVARFGILHDNVASLDAFDVRIKPELAVDTPVSTHPCRFWTNIGFKLGGFTSLHTCRYILSEIGNHLTNQIDPTPDNGPSWLMIKAKIINCNYFGDSQAIHAER